ncbi:MAG: anthranilate phosphoribosyltransferase [Alphaproteobacteria bacterium TMED87]|nr:anthranilate phosphoribosyltransferase [Rhodospirillaceae bacterium]OUV07693.1 MAG: anthranilate phosphoribosyltransferase [Alphaproteobacteria bacterium TMED87]
MIDIKSTIQSIISGDSLSEVQSENLFTEIMDGNLSNIQISSILTALSIKGENVSEIVGATKVLRRKSLSVSAPDNSIDTCGTGGDKLGTYNISTAVSFVIAGCGIPVAKHGNRKASSKSGTADVLEALNININCTPDNISDCLKNANIGFLFAQNHHSAMRNVAPVRSELGIRTIFNIIGPLSNPANAKKQLLGVFDEKWLVPLAESLRNLGSERAWIVHGTDGLDEISISGDTLICELKDNKITNFTLNPLDAGLKTSPITEIKGGDPLYNAKAILNLLDGEKNAYRNIVLINAAAALMISNKVDNITEGVVIASESIDSGAAKNALNKLQIISNKN